MSALVQLLAAALLVLVLAPPAAAQRASCADVANDERVLAELAAAINREREGQGLRALSVNARVARAARSHGCDMVEKDFFSHTGSDGSSATTRLQAVGYSPCFSAENLAYGQTGAGQAVAAWMESQGHRDNILSRRARALGAAAVRPAGQAGPIRWVAVFATPC